jgi:hypothetical protein
VKDKNAKKIDLTPSFLRKVIKICIVFAVFLLVVLLLLNFLASRFINKESIREKIQTTVSEKIGGEVEFDRADLSIFPLTHVVMHQGRFSIPEKAAGSFDSVSIRPKILYLLIGKVRIAKISVTAPDISIKLPERSPQKAKVRDKGEKDKDDPLAVLKEHLFSLLAPLSADAPDLVVSVGNGTLDMVEKDQSLFRFQDIDAHVVFPPKGLKLNLTCSSSLWENISTEIDLDPKDFRGNGSINLSNFQPKKLLDYFSPRPDYHIGDSMVNFNLDFTLDGMEELQAEVQGSFPKLTLLREDNEIVIKGTSMKGLLQMDKDTTAVSLKELDLDYPRLELTGNLSVEKTPKKVSLHLEGRGMDVSSTREAVLALAGEIPITQKIFNIVRSGTIPLITFRSQGSSFGDLGKTESFTIEGNMNEGNIYIPGADLDLKEVRGDVVIKNGILKGENLEARLEHERGHEGKLKLGLKGGDAPFHLDMIVESDLTQFPPLLKRFVKNKDFIKEVNQISDIKGKALGRLILGENLKNVRTKIDISEINLTAHYQRIPHLLEINRGKLSYDGGEIGIQNLDGSMGKSSFSGLTLQLALGKDPHLEILSGETHISMDEIYPWLLSYKTLRDALKDFKSVHGDVSLSTIEVNGPLMKPKNWKYKMSGKVNKLDIDSTFFPDTLSVEKGNLEGSKDRLTFTETQANILDASFTISGTLHEPFEGLGKTDLTGRGTFGPKTTEWFSDTINLPSEVRVRSPLSLTEANMSWERDGKTTFKGNFAFQRGADVSVELSTGPEGFIIHNLTMKDEESHASLMLNLGKETNDFQFAGNVSQATLDKVFTREIFLNGWLRGDFQTHILKNQPLQTTARGKLEGEDIVFPWKLNVPLKMSSFSFTGENSKLLVEPTKFTWGESSMVLTGDVNFASEGFLLDMDLSADEIAFDTIKSAFDKGEDDEKDETSWGLPLMGDITLTADSFTYKQFAWKPLLAHISFEKNRVNASVKEASLCNISSTGSLGISPQDVSLDLQFVSSNQDLEPVLTCLWDKKGWITGNFNLNGNVTAQGKGEALTESLNYRGGVLAKVVAYLNVTEIFMGTLPDMTKEGFAYKSITGLGSLEGNTLVLKEVIIDGASMKLASQGDINFIDQTLDLMILVSPLKTVDRFAGNIPLLKDITGGTIVTIPLKVTGDFENTKITYAPQSSVGSGLLGIMKKTLKFPVELINPVVPNTGSDLTIDQED